MLVRMESVAVGAKGMKTTAAVYNWLFRKKVDVFLITAPATIRQLVLVSFNQLEQ